MNKTRTIHLKTAACCLLLATLLGLPAHSFAATGLDRVVALVNGEPLLASDLNQRILFLRATSKAASELGPETLAREALDALIMEQLQLQYAKARDLSVPPEVLEQALESIARRNNLSPDRFGQALQQQGLSLAILREQTRRKLLTDLLRKNITESGSRVSNREISNLIQQESGKLAQGTRYRLQQAMIKAPNGSPVQAVNQARQQAYALRQRVLHGEDFARITNTGDTPEWQEADALPVAARRALALLQPGEVSEVVRDAQGFHFYKLLERQGGEQTLTPSYHVRHILVATGKAPGDAGAEAKIRDLYRQLQQGADFATLARTHSDDPGSAAKDGDLGWTVRGQMVAPFEQVMVSQPLQTVSQPFQTRYGWHILEVLEQKNVDRRDEQLRTQVSSQLSERRGQELYLAWLQSLRNSAHIDYRLPQAQESTQLQ
ncbi:MAG: peptidylprolyl isomerase [Thiothrix sp.]|nr:peptidylprolyl isomerase [Thiothrix sp.]